MTGPGRVGGRRGRANLGLDHGVRFHVREGARGVLVSDERGQELADVVCGPSSYSYRVMSRSDRMPVLAGERSWAARLPARCQGRNNLPSPAYPARGRGATRPGA